MTQTQICLHTTSYLQDFYHNIVTSLASEISNLNPPVYGIHWKYQLVDITDAW